MLTTSALTDLTHVTTPKGHQARFQTRPGTSDSSLVMGIIGEDEYGLKDLPPLTGWAIDIGAHIGTVAVALALDHPGLSVVAVEALPENVEVLRENVRLNGLDAPRHPDGVLAGGPRVNVHSAAGTSERDWLDNVPVSVTYGWSRADNQPDLYMQDNRYIGGMVGANETSQTVDASPLSLQGLRNWYGCEEVELLKIDCEGCEWFFLTSPEIKRVKLIIGEFHVGRHGNAARLRELLEPTHDVEMDDTKNVGLFRATRR